MRTDDLVNLLATGVEPVRPSQVVRRHAAALGLGLAGAIALMANLLGVRADLASAALQPMFWVKVAFVAALVGAALLGALRLSRPGRRLARVPLALAAPVFALWALAALELVRAGSGERGQLFLGSTAQSCPLLIALLSAPLFVALMWVMRDLAPTRLRLAGAATGFLAGALGALVYSLHCPESAAAFIGFWYLVGMLIPAVLGALLGPRLLRW